VTDAYEGLASRGANVSVIFDFTLSISAATIRVGQNLTIGVQSTASGLTYAYTGLPPGCTPEDAPTLTCSPSVVGTYSVEVTVTDGAGNSASRAFLIDVVAAPSPLPRDNGTPASPTAVSTAPSMNYLLLFAIAAFSSIVGGVVVALGGWWLRRPPRRSERRSAGSSDDDPLRPGGTKR
jgi:PKD domain-containing protein